MGDLLGPYTLQYYRSAFIFALIGAFLFKYITYNPNGKSTSPDTFNLLYWIKNNWFDMVGSFLAFYVIIRFKNELLIGFKDNPVAIWLQVFTDSFFFHISIGILFTHLIKFFRKKLTSLKL